METTGIDMTSAPLSKVKKRVEEEDASSVETFADSIVFSCDPDTFQNCRLGKKKYVKYKTYVGEDEMGQRIREYGLNNPKKSIIIKNSVTGDMLYLRRV